MRGADLAAAARFGGRKPAPCDERADRLGAAGGGGRARSYHRSGLSPRPSAALDFSSLAVAFEPPRGQALSGHEGVLASLREQIAGLQYERRKDAVVMRMAPRLQSSAEKLRKHLLGRSHGRAAGKHRLLARILSCFPSPQPSPLQPPTYVTGRSGGMPGQSTAGELIAALEKELQMMGKSPKAMIIVGRAKASVDSLEQARREGAEREDELLQLLVENLAPINEDGGLTVGGGGPGASPPSKLG